MKKQFRLAFELLKTVNDKGATQAEKTSASSKITTLLRSGLEKHNFDRYEVHSMQMVHYLRGIIVDGASDRFYGERDEKIFQDISKVLKENNIYFKVEDLPRNAKLILAV